MCIAYFYYGSLTEFQSQCRGAATNKCLSIRDARDRTQRDRQREYIFHSFHILSLFFFAS